MTKVFFQSEAYDTNNNFDSTTNYRYTAPVTGYYQINAQVGDVLAASTTFQMIVYKNGSKLLGSQISNSPAGTRITCQSINTLVALTATDYLEVYIAGNTGDTLCGGTFGAGNESFTFFSGYLVSRT